MGEYGKIKWYLCVRTPLQQCKYVYKTARYKMTYSKDIHCEALAHGNKKSRYGLRAFLLGILFATVIFLPFIIYDNGLFL